MRVGFVVFCFFPGSCDVNVELGYTNVETWQLFRGCCESEYSAVMNFFVALWFINLCLLV